MATIRKYKGKHGPRYTARVRKNGREATDTFGSKAAAESWARAQETAIETGVFKPVDGTGLIFADLVDDFVKHRCAQRRAPGATFANCLDRLKEEHGLEPAALIAGSAQFWRRHALDRIKNGVESQTAVGDLAYAASVLAHAKREGRIADASGPAQARILLREDGLRVVSRQRERRISDDELDAILVGCTKVQTSIPLVPIVQFGLATAMRRGEILRLLGDDVDEVARIALIRSRKHPKDKERVDECPLLKAHPQWPRWDALEIIKAQPRSADGRVFPYLGDTLGWAFEKACEIAKVKGVVFHLLRHESLSRYAELRKFDPLRLQAVGGHRDLRALNRYAKVSARTLINE